MKPYYEQDGITIYHGDCREVLPLVPHHNLLMTDPPYGIGENAHRQRSRTKLAKTTDYGDFDWDVKPPEWVFGLMLEKSTEQIIWGGNFFGLPASSCWLVWDKDNSGCFADCELAWTNLPKAVRRIKYRWNGMLQEPGLDKEVRMHPTQKPVEVIKWAVTHSTLKTGSILDPFMGSGTSLVAAKSLGWTATGIEMDERYCEIAALRLGQGVLNLTMEADA